LRFSATEVVIYELGGGVLWPLQTRSYVMLLSYHCLIYFCW